MSYYIGHGQFHSVKLVPSGHLQYNARIYSKFNCYPCTSIPILQSRLLLPPNLPNFNFLAGYMYCSFTFFVVKYFRIANYKKRDKNYFAENLLATCKFYSKYFCICLKYYTIEILLYENC